MRAEDYEAFWKPFLSGIGDPVLNPYWNQGSPGDSTIILVHDLISNMICRRSLIISKRGYLGLAPAQTKKGDLICVLSGCSVPVIIGNENDSYKFVGDS
jgi:hypothetical protein